LRVNERIRAREVLVIDEHGERLGVMSVPEALMRAREAGLDLVEVAPNVIPPVCRILDYGRFKYEQAKKERESKKHARHSELREVRFKPKIGAHDIEAKAKKAEEFLREGDKVKMSVMFRGREITHPDIGRDLLIRLAERLKNVGFVEKPPTMEGRFMNMIMAPGPAKKREQQAAPGPETATESVGSA
jgi:translation initiation factor IF-3